MNNFEMTTTPDKAMLAKRFAGLDQSRADWKYMKLKEEIEAFQNALSSDYDVCIQLASFGTNILMQVTDIGYQNPDLLYFYGIVNGNVAQLIQHMSQLSFLLMAVRREDPTEPPRRIGFAVDDE